MIAFVTTRFVVVLVTTIVVMAAAPYAIVLTHADAINAGSVTSTAHGDAARSHLIAQVKTAGDDVLAKINTAEVSCDAQIAQLAGQSKLSARATQAAIDKGKSEFNTATAPFLREVRDDEDQFDRLSSTTPQTEQLFLARLSEVRAMAIGAGGEQGVLATVCQTILVEVQVAITPVVIVSSGGGGD
jgi:hypothetical protein